MTYCLERLKGNNINVILTVRKAPYDESQVVEHRKTLI